MTVAASPATPTTTTVPRGAWMALILATLGFGVNFWAWALLSPLGPVYVSRGLAADASLIVAIPVLVGSLGRIPMGALSDRFGGRIMFPLASLVTVVPVLFLGLVGQFSAFLVGAAVARGASLENACRAVEEVSRRAVSDA